MFPYHREPGSTPAKESDDFDVFWQISGSTLSNRVAYKKSVLVLNQSETKWDENGAQN